jgi:diguanylate cyclase (GGDEF)-like protein/PAS domain S-box-containing protein
VSEFDLSHISHTGPEGAPEALDIAAALAAFVDAALDGDESHLRVLAAHLPMVVWTVDADERIVTAFGRGMTSLGLEPGDLDDTELAAWGEEGVLHVRRALAGEAVTFGSQGVINGRAWAMRHFVTPHPQGGAVAISIDRTEHYLAETELDISEERFRSLAESAPVGIFLSRPGSGIIYTNPEVQAQFGLSGDEMLGQGWQTAVHPDDLASLLADARLLRTTGTAFDQEYRVVRRDGSERWMHVRAQQITDRSGTYTGAVGTSVDVTDRRRHLDELIASEERFRSLAEGAPIGIFLADLDGNVRYMNPVLAEISHRDPDALGGMDWLQTVHPDDLERLGEVFLAFRHEDAPFDIEFRIVQPDGSIRWSHSFARKITGPSGEPIGIVGASLDVTERHVADTRQRESEELTQAILENAAEGIVTVDEGGTILAFNAAAESIFGWDSEQVIGQSFGILLPEPHREIYLGYLATFRDTGTMSLAGGPTQEIPGLRQDGENVEIELAITEVPWRGQTAFCALVRDISERKEFERELEHQATHDPLTSLPNRALLAAQLESALARAYRNERSVAVLFVSLDRMKLVTDSLGHRAGDELRVAAAHRLQGLVRPTDTVTRFGEDEFVILAEDLTDISEAVDLAQRVIEAIDVPFDLTVDEAFINVNVGISFALDGLGTAESLISDADVAMFRAKEKGGSQLEIFDSDMRAWINSRRKTENALRHGLERDEFELHYQPIISLADGTIKGFEALIRWNRPHLGMVPPMEFIPVAEETGLIIPLGEWILDDACRQIAAWQGMRNGDPLTVSVNLSGRQLAQRDIAGRVDAALSSAGADPKGLVIEITETVLLDDVDSAVRTLDALREIGVKLSIDDFGTGYSSLTYLRRFPIDIVKIDRSFVNQLGTDSRDASIVEMVITLAQGLELDCVAEGVETKEQLASLRRLECSYAQGYFFAKPQPVAEADSLLQGKGFALV